jgi:hypothetical protein
VPEADHKRQHAIFEFIKTEILYRDDLQLILDTYAKDGGDQIFPKSDAAFIFGSVTKGAASGWGKMWDVSNTFVHKLDKRDKGEVDKTMVGVRALCVIFDISIWCDSDNVCAR